MKQPNKNDYFIDIDGTEILPYDKAYRAYKEYADDLEDYIKHLSQAKNNEVLDLVSNTLFVCMDKDNDILSVHRTEKGAVSKRKELLKEYLKIGVFKMELLE